VTYETDEQQVEALKAWWAANGNAILVGAGLGLAVILGWQGFQKYQADKAAEASDLYGAIAASTEVSEQQASFDTLKGDFSGTPYAGLGGLTLAKNLVEAEDYATAASTLEWVSDNAVEDDIAALAALRQARVLLQLNELDAALAALPAVPVAGFVSMQADIRGDILLAQGKKDEARVAYQEAKNSGGVVSDSQFLQMKLDDLAQGS